MFKLNTSAPFFVTTAFMDLLIKGAIGKGKKTSVVINIFSKSASSRISRKQRKSQCNGCIFFCPGFLILILSYAFTKGALEHMSTFLAADFAQRKIPVRVVAIAPALFPSEIVDNPGFEESATKALPNFLSPHPLLRMGKYVSMYLHLLDFMHLTVFTSLEELALSANYLVANEYVNGIVLP